MTRAVAASRVSESTPAKEAPSTRSPTLPRGYFRRSELPLASLAFVLPFVILYEVGTHYFAVDPVSHTETHIIAFKLILEFFGFLGATGRYLPALAVAVMLLSWHIARNDAWKVMPGTLAGMTLESMLLAIPMWIFGFAFMRYLPLFGISGAWRGNMVFSLGAGIYEELIFRLVAFTFFHLFFRDVLLMPKGWSNLLMVLISAILFAGYHYLGNETFQLRSFVFRIIAGVYFGILFIVRGFGITAGAHAFYDIFATSILLSAT